MGAQLVGALEQARYFEYSYYRVPNGFALVARLERIGPDGTPLPEEFRFLLPGSQEPFSLGVYIKQLFFAPEGFYQQIVIVVMDRPFTATGGTLDAPAAARLLSGGANRLSNDFETMRFTEAHRVSALIYDYEFRIRAVPEVDHVFIDVDGIEPGADFALKIQTALAESPICILLIGPQRTHLSGPASTRGSHLADECLHQPSP